MTVPVVQSVNGWCNARLIVWAFGAINLPEYHCSMLVVELQFLPGQESMECSDLIPVEHIYDVLEQGVKSHHTPPTNLSELWTVLANIWQIIPVGRFQKLVQSMPRRVAAVIKVREGPTRY
ncbi:uncharacterized protein TNCV_1515821 [Trichonephila clavipes]|nr:uncharacterized protein TNCV_1515821 [Trichonephila clavipes]